MRSIREVPGYSCEREYRIIRKDGDIRCIHEKIRNISDDSETPTGVQGVIYDITEAKEAEEETKALQLQLQHSQKMEAVGRLAAGIAHDFNNILAAIMANASFGRENLTKKTFGYKQFQEILNASNLAKDLVTQMLTFARNDRPAVRLASLNDVIRDSLSMVSGSLSPQVSLETDLDESLAETNFDSNQILQVILNLCNNARDAVDGDGTITIKSSATTLDEGFCAKYVGLRPGKYCLFSVSDDGEGISSEDIDKIFDPFFTTKDTGKGTGLGLSVTLGIIQNHGGIIDVESQPDKGTSVLVYLPATPAS